MSDIRRLNVNLTEELYLALREKLARENISVTDFITKLVKWYVRKLDEGIKPNSGAGSGSQSASQGAGFGSETK